MLPPAASTPPPSVGDSESARSALRAAFEAAGQGHVFRFAAELPPTGLARLYAGARAVNLASLARIRDGHGLASAPPRPEPLGAELFRRDDLFYNKVRRADAEARGRELLRAGKVAVVTVAGGQGTRLGWSGPKGCYPIGPGSRTLFDIHAGAVAEASREAGRPVPWVLVVSPQTIAATLDHLVSPGLPGIERAQVRVACQGVLPALDDEGRLLLEARDSLALSPDGHGGTYRALRESGTLAWLLNLGVEELSYFQVDNPLAPPADPLFLGIHALAGSQFSSKVFRKAHPAERVGVVVRLDGKPGVIEYSELPADLAALPDDRGGLLYGHANMAAHAVNLAFAAGVAFMGLPIHRVRKRVAHLDAEGRRVEPAEPNAWKHETFFFDAMRWASKGLAVEVERSLEFAPLKNATGDDSPETCRALLRAAGRWPS
jgi:UDP-N-acetylglucosamine/UDP-N-acetylgalactosamine diphosphorylase